MNIGRYNELNEIYEPLHEKAKNIYKEIIDNGYKASLGWYNMHSVKYKDKYITEFFPIPVITVEKICDIGLDIDTIFVEATISREKALKIDYDFFIQNYNIEVYGVDDYLNDFYNASMKSSDIKLKIQESNENEIHIAAYFHMNLDINKLAKAFLKFIGIML